MSKPRYTLGKVFSIGSSSAGNGYYLEINRKGYQTPFKLLIECGFSYKELSKRLAKQGVGINDLNAILVTHLHNDHSISVKELVNRGKNVYAPRSVFEKYNVLDSVKARNVMKEKQMKMIADGIEVLPFDLEHKNDDDTNIENLGYIITVDGDQGKYRILFVIDTQYIKYNLRKYQFNTIFIEANNMRRSIYMALKQAERKGDLGKKIHFTRVLKSHMLAENTVKTLIGSKKNAGLDLKNTHFIYLMHLTARGHVNPLEVKMHIKNELKKHNKCRAIVVSGKKRTIPIVKQFQTNGEVM